MVWFTRIIFFSLLNIRVEKFFCRNSRRGNNLEGYLLQMILEWKSLQPYVEVEIIELC